ncbi:MAG: type VI secretion system-associated protein TagF [Polaromonas sp.]
MSNLSTHVNLTYFGKIPSRGDFVKSGASLSLLTSLDNWLARAMESMSEDTRWKNLYDEVQPFHFAFLGPRSKMAIGGHLTASRDAAQRRFPFVTAATMEVGDPEMFIARSPLALSRLWNRLANFSVSAAGATEATEALNAIAGCSIEVDLGSKAYDAHFADFLDLQTVGSLENQLKNSGFEGNCRQLILGLGLLLQPVMASGSKRLEKSLCLPLPSDPMYQYLTASFWLSLINPFLQRADFELSLYITQSKQRPVLIVGFNGASSLTLEAVLNPRIAQEHFITLDHAAWVEESVASDYGVTKLSSYLEQSRLSLASARQSFNEVFLGI